MLTKCFVDHKGRVSESIQKAFLQVMVNSFTSLTGCIWGRADHCGWNTRISDLCRGSVFL